MDRLEEILHRLRDGRIDVDAAVELVRAHAWATHPVKGSLLDVAREERTGIEEVVFAASKSTEDLIAAVTGSVEARGRVLVTRLRPDQVEPLAVAIPELSFNPVARTAWLRRAESPAAFGTVAVVSAGTSDRPVAEEAVTTLEHFGTDTVQVSDVGVAGLGRLLDALPRLAPADVLVVVAGMEGALPGVVAGLVRAPLIAVPASVGYGTAFGGFTALFSMLASCSPGITVVNIDNGFGAAVAAVKIIRHLRRATKTDGPGG